MNVALSTAQDQRVYNFSAGPATLPLPVLEEIKDELLNYRGSGMSVMELSHRGQTFIEIQRETERRMRELMNIPAEYSVLFVQGGGRLQNVMIPLNLAAAEGTVGDYLVTGAWSKYSFQDAQALGRGHLAWDGAPHRFARLPSNEEIAWAPNASYVHFTSNETIHGIQFHSVPQAPRGVPLICDSSSDLMSRPVRVADYGMIYACAQKNAGIAGLTIVIIRRDLLERVTSASGYLHYRAHADSEDQMYNTPPTFPIYVTGLVCKWLQDEIGGLERMAAINRDKAAVLYRALDEHAGFYIPHAARNDRSLMNVAFRTASPELDDRFVAEARRHRLSDLKGHRSLGGMRASIYNAMPLAGVEALAQFVRDFAQRNG